MREQTKTKQDLVRLLVAEHGMLKASQLANVPYDLVRQWESRRKRRALKAAQQAGVTVSQNPVTVAADNVASELEQNGKETKLSLSRYARRAAKDSESLSTREAPLVHKVAQIASLTHPNLFGAEAQPAKFTLNVLNMGALEITAGQPDSAE